MAVIVGTAISLAVLFSGWGEVASCSRLSRGLLAVVSVGLGMLLMAMTDTEHPPAAGTALGLVVVGWTPSAVLFVLLGSVTLSAIHLVLRPYLKNLLQSTKHLSRVRVSFIRAPPLADQRMN